MEIFTDELRGQMIGGFLSVLLLLFQMIGVFAREILYLIVLPVYEFSVVNILMSLAGIVIVAAFTGALFRFFGSFFR